VKDIIEYQSREAFRNSADSSGVGMLSACFATLFAIISIALVITENMLALHRGRMDSMTNMWFVLVLFVGLIVTGISGAACGMFSLWRTFRYGRKSRLGALIGIWYPVIFCIGYPILGHAFDWPFWR
jgi:hypothetical protein